MNQVIVITGVSGSGKDFLLQRLAESLPEQITIFNFGQELFEEVCKHHPELVNRDQLTQLPFGEVRPYVNLTAQKALSRQPVLLNSHLTFNVGSDVVFSRGVNLQLLPMKYIHVSASIEDILSRRRSERRQRLLQEAVEIEFHQELSIFLTSRIASEIGSGFVHIWNRDDNVESNLNLLRDELVCFL